MFFLISAVISKTNLGRFRLVTESSPWKVGRYSVNACLCVADLKGTRDCQCTVLCHDLILELFEVCAAVLHDGHLVFRCDKPPRQPRLCIDTMHLCILDRDVALRDISLQLQTDQQPATDRIVEFAFTAAPLVQILLSTYVHMYSKLTSILIGIPAGTAKPRTKAFQCHDQILLLQNLEKCLLCTSYLERLLMSGKNDSEAKRDCAAKVARQATYDEARYHSVCATQSCLFLASF